MSSAGCYLTNVYINHIQYVDYSVVLSPPPKGLLKLLHIVEEFSTVNDMIFYGKKISCMKIKAHVNIRIPYVFLNGHILKWIPENKYLGVTIANDFKDGLDIK